MGRSSSQQQQEQHRYHQSSNSYQHTLTIQQLDEPPPPTPSERLHQFASNPGNSFLQPNVGRTNRYDYDIFGLTLMELLERLRWSILASTAWLLVVLTLTWWKRFLRPKALFTSILLAVLDGGLLVAVATRPLDAGYSHKDNTNTTRRTGGGGGGVWTAPRILFGTDDDNRQSSSSSSAIVAVVDRVVHIAQLLDDWGKCVLDHPVRIILYMYIVHASSPAVGYSLTHSLTHSNHVTIVGKDSGLESLCLFLFLVGPRTVGILGGAVVRRGSVCLALLLGVLSRIPTRLCGGVCGR